MNLLVILGIAGLALVAVSFVRLLIARPKVDRETRDRLRREEDERACTCNTHPGEHCTVHDAMSIW